MTTHTPGPWKWWTSNSWRRLKSETDRSQSHNVLEPYLCRDGHPDCMITNEDMALIAAAPELLEALKNATFALALTAQASGNENYLEAARAAIAKAEGRTS